MRRERAAGQQTVEQPHTQLTRQVAVTGARGLEWLVSATLPLVGAHVAFGHQRQGFERMGDVGIGQAEVTVPALAAGDHQLGVDQLGNVRARGLRRDTRGLRQLAGRHELATHQRRQHARTGGVADHRGDLGESGFRRRHSTERRTR